MRHARLKASQLLPIKTMQKQVNKKSIYNNEEN